ncbi:hypothetical protein Cgig2_007319 [Carnegiea gigantea]|uniref:TF-B3 domain-containing protein n=1 Tax=Carnegiea gigantea TaxID=171969 RepID=A0A9Q1KZV5_9CARY|nr:hypothetical protein Cgig2_007319 [Carnegiea gigantea]
MGMNAFLVEIRTIMFIFVTLHSSMAVDDDISGSPSFLKIILAPRLDLQKLYCSFPFYTKYIVKFVLGLEEPISVFILTKLSISESPYTIHQEIPPEFMKRYGGNLLDVVNLSIPSGAVWEVKLVRKKGRAWLQNGWPEFVNFYSILHTHVLKFTLEGNSGFHVIIMSNNACEIEYPVDVRTSSTTQKRKKIAIKTISPNSSRRAKVTATVMDTNRKRTNRYCLQQITESNHRIKQNLNIPLEFVRSYLHRETRMFILQSASHETWSVKCMIGDSHVKLTKGWRNFARDNKLQVGDICIFELMKVTKTKFKVGILPAAAETPRIDAEVKL